MRMRAFILWLHVMWSGLAAGMIVAALTYYLMPHIAWHLPGGSFSAGFMAGMLVTRKQMGLRPRWLAMVCCALCGVCGWAILVPFMGK